MKILLGWLCDPYVHVFLIGLVLARLAMDAGKEPIVAPASSCSYCERCHDYHEGWVGGCKFAGAVAGLFGGE